MAVSYGYLAMIQPHIVSPEKYYEPFSSSMVGDSLATNFVYGTADTYLYDELLLSEAEDMLDDVTFYNQVNKGIRLGNFKPVQRKLSLLYLPILTFHEEKVNQDKEFIAILEGITQPIWGLSFSPDKI